MSPTTPASFKREGLFILPGESKSAFEVRCSSLQIKPTPDTAAARQRVQTLFGCDPAWVEVTYSNQGLFPWEAACTWYDEQPIIQLRRNFQTHTRLLGMYEKDEVLAHEYVHAIRAPLGESKFEELFAYLTSSPFRAHLGPFFQKPCEALVFVTLLALAAVTGGCSLYSEWLWTSFVWLVSLAGVALCFFITRLVHTSWQFWRCYRHLAAITSAAFPLMVRLTDEEIVRFSRMTPAAIKSWVAEQQDFRWQSLRFFAHFACKNCSREAQ